MRKELLVIIASILAIGAIVIMYVFSSTLAGVVAYSLIWYLVTQALK